MMADEHDPFLRQIQEEVRREQLQKIWERYNALIIGAVVLFLVAVGTYKFLENRRMTSAQTDGAKFAAAEDLSNEKKNDDAEKAFAELAKSGTAGYAALAKLQLAGMQVKAGKTADAIATYESLVKQSGADQLLKSFAQLQAASLRMPDADYSEIQNRLTPLIGDDKPYSKSARELLGVAAYEAKKYDAARKYLEPLLVDEGVGPAQQERVKIVMADIAAAQIAEDKPAAAPKSASDAEAKAGQKADQQPDAGNGDASGKTQ
jgi:hypothetical protein